MVRQGGGGFQRLESLIKKPQTKGNIMILLGDKELSAAAVIYIIDTTTSQVTP